MCASINCSSSKITAVVAISPPRDLIHTAMFRTMMSTQAFSPHKWTHKSQRRPVNGAIRLILIHFRRTYFLQIRPEMAICVQIHWKKRLCADVKWFHPWGRVGCWEEAREHCKSQQRLLHLIHIWWDALCFSKQHLSITSLFWTNSYYRA